MKNAWHEASLDEIRSALGTDLKTGLSLTQVEAQREKYGENKLEEKKKKTFLARLFAQFSDFMVIVLIVAALISIAVNFFATEPDWIEPIIIIAIVLLNAILGVVQESKAEAALEALQNMSAPRCKVMRGGKTETIESHELVPGDVILLEAGDFVPADARLIESASLKSEESALTGESVPVDKFSDHTVHGDAPLGDRRNMVYSGCAISYGRATAVVVSTGMNTEIGKIASLLSGEKESMTPLQVKLAQLGKMLGIGCLGICAVVFAVGLAAGNNLMEMFMAAVSLAVAAIPEGLPAIVTIVLALGVQRMVAKNAIIRRLPAVETLGSASVICSDKTGTLTQNRMTLVSAWIEGALCDLNERWREDIRTLIEHAGLCCDGKVSREADGSEKHTGDPTETAIIAALLHQDILSDTLNEAHKRVAEIPFDSDRKLMTTVNLFGGKPVAIVKGAPDILLSKCNLPDGKKAQVAEKNDEMARRALRVLAVAYKPLDGVPSDPTPEVLENGLTFMGLIGMIDPPREEAKEAIRECISAGIRPIMITGDHVTTAVAIAEQLGIMRKGDLAISGAELSDMSDEALGQNIEKYSVYARVTPQDKIRIVKAWQSKGQIVSMTGDGVNDAPALKAADIGCAMGITGTDVAKGAADMILTDDNFATIVVAVKQGRGIYDNIRKSVQFLLSCNIGEIITVFLAMLIWPTFGAPLLAIQLLWINLVTDSLPALALGMEPVEYDIMKRKPRGKNESIFSNGVGLSTALQGVMIGLLTLAAYYVGWQVLDTVHNHDVGRTMAFAVLAFSQLIHAFNVRSTHSLFKVGFFSNRYMAGAFVVSGLLLTAVLTVPFLQTAFELTPLTGSEWLWVGIFALVPLVLVELVKFCTRLFRKKNA